MNTKKYDGNKPSFYSILTAKVRYDNRLSFAEKVFYSEITCRTNALGYCYTSNSKFASLYNKDVRTITRWITHLNKLKYINIELIKNDNGSILQRRIYLNDSLGGIDIYVHRGIDKNVAKGIDKNVQYNNIKYNNKKIKYKNYEQRVYSEEDMEKLYDNL